MSELDTLGKRIKNRRIQLKISPHKLALQTGIAPPTIYRLEADQIANLRSDNLVRMAKALHTSVDYLTCVSDDPQPRDFIQGDKNAQYIFELYSQMDVEQVRELLHFAEYTRYRGDPIKEVLHEYYDLVDFCRESVNNKTWNEQDPRFRRAELRRIKPMLDRMEKELAEELKEPTSKIS